MQAEYFIAKMFVMMYGLKAQINWLKLANSFWTKLFINALFTLFFRMLVVDLIYFPFAQAKSWTFC